MRYCVYLYGVHFWARLAFIHMHRIQMNEWCYNLFNCPLSIELVVKVEFAVEFTSAQRFTTIKSSYYWAFIERCCGFQFLLFLFTCSGYYDTYKLMHTQHTCINLQLFCTHYAISWSIFSRGFKFRTYLTINHSKSPISKRTFAYTWNQRSFLFFHLLMPKLRVCTRSAIIMGIIQWKREAERK